MEASIYIDVVFLAAWGMDTLLLWAAGRIAGFRAGRLRLCLGGLLSAGLYCGWLCLFRQNGGLLLSLGLLAAGTAAAYCPKSGRHFLRLIGAGLLASFLLGGGLTAVLTFSAGQRLFGQGITLRRGAPWWILPWACLTAYVLLKAGGKWLEAHIVRRQEYCTAMVRRRGRWAEARVLIDTGNGLRQRDGRGVVILELPVLLPLFSAAEGMALLRGERTLRGMEPLAFTSLGNADGRLWGVRMEELRLCYGEKTVTHRDILVGMTTEGFTGAYEGLTPPCLLEEESG